MRPHKVRAGTTGYLIAPPPPYAEGWEVQFPNDDAMLCHTMLMRKLPGMGGMCDPTVILFKNVYEERPLGNRGNR